MLDRQLDVLRPVAMYAIVVGKSQVVLGCSPVRWEVLLGPDLQSLLIVLDRQLDVLRLVAPYACLLYTSPSPRDRG